MNAPQKAKAFAWSFSKLKNFETCPKRHYEVDIAKNFKDSSEQLDYGNLVHDKMAKACLGSAPLPADMSLYQKWVDKVRAFPGELMVEKKYALTRDLLPTSWFGGGAWYRGVGDAVVVDMANGIAIIVDWKTGKPKPAEYAAQLVLMAQCIFSHFPKVKRVISVFVWLAHDDKTVEVFERADMPKFWAAMLPRIDAMVAADQMLSYPPKPGHLCRSYCPVQSCPFHGKGTY